MSTPANQNRSRRKRVPTTDGLFSMRLASAQAVTLGTLLAVCSFVILSGVTTLLSIDMGVAVNRALSEAGSAASWVLPMCISALIAGIAVIFLPDWRTREAIGLVDPVDSADVRRLIGTMCLGVTLVLLVWTMWILLAWLVPGWSPGSSGTGTLIGLILTLTLAILGSRASLGTREQRWADARAVLIQQRTKAGRVHFQTFRVNERPAVWPIVVGVGGLLAPVLLTLCFGIFGIVATPTTWAMAGYIFVFSWIPIAVWVEAFSGRKATRCTAHVIAILATLFAAFAGACMVGADTGRLAPAVWMFVLTLAPLITLIRLRGKYLLAAFGLRGLQKSIASNYAYLRRLEEPV